MGLEEMLMGFAKLRVIHKYLCPAVLFCTSLSLGAVDVTQAIEDLGRPLDKAKAKEKGMVRFTFSAVYKNRLYMGGVGPRNPVTADIVYYEPATGTFDFIRHPTVRALTINKKIVNMQVADNNLSWLAKMVIPIISLALWRTTLLMGGTSATYQAVKPMPFFNINIKATT